MIIYKTTNLINGKIYIGKDKINKDRYFGSGTILKNAIKKYKKKNFKKEILEHCDNEDHLNEREKYWIKKLKSQDRNIGYNIDGGGHGGDVYMYLTEEQKDRHRKLSYDGATKWTKDPNNRKLKIKSAKEMWQRKDYQDKMEIRLMKHYYRKYMKFYKDIDGHINKVIDKYIKNIHEDLLKVIYIEFRDRLDLLFNVSDYYNINNEIYQEKMKKIHYLWYFYFLLI